MSEYFIKPIVKNIDASQSASAAESSSGSSSK